MYSQSYYSECHLIMTYSNGRTDCDNKYGQRQPETHEPALSVSYVETNKRSVNQLHDQPYTEARNGLGECLITVWPTSV